MIEAIKMNKYVIFHQHLLISCKKFNFYYKDIFAELLNVKIKHSKLQ